MEETRATDPIKTIEAPNALMQPTFPGFLTLLIALAASIPLSSQAAAAIKTPLSQVDYQKQILPILQTSCFSCHGPEKQKADLRLDHRETTLRGGESGPALVPGDSTNSLLVRLITAQDDKRVMPQKGDRLSTDQIQLIRSWIDQGAAYPESSQSLDNPLRTHWAFQPIQNPKPPAPHPTWPAINPIDAFIQAKLVDQGLSPSAEADRTTLIRRLYLVMLGVPPTPEEVEAFLQDPSPNAFEAKVDQVLADSRYGERWARHWLDLVRFAESNGFETNRERPNAWRFRDYVIASLNRDTPYDRFILEQLAGDTLGMDVATGFLVAGPVDIVGSPDPTLTLQQRADELDDMVNTTGTAFLGLTLGCARCHSHKFDPISHQEYYSMTALFSGVRHGERGEPLPNEAKIKVDALSQKIATLESQLTPFLASNVTRRLAPSNAPAAIAATPSPKTLRPPVNAIQNEENFKPVEARWIRFMIEATSGGQPCIDEFEIWSQNTNVALASRGAKAHASSTLPGYEIHQLKHLNDGLPGNPHSWISNEEGRGWAIIELSNTVPIEKIVWGRDRDGVFKDRVATQYRIEVSTTSNLWTVVASSADRVPYQPGSNQPKGPVYIFEGLPDSEAQQGKQWLTELESTRKQRDAAAKPIMVYAGTFQKPPMTHRLHRGDPMQKREEVPPGTLKVFKPIELSPETTESDRRTQLARWIASPENPLTARVFVNRVWQNHFGIGIVDTPNDFGRNGTRPSHPELLDWLATDFIQHGWSIKQLQKRILMSAAWRQSSQPRESALKVDASSRLLWRFPPRRIEAEAIRDSILAVTGSLDTRMGGPSFFLHDVDRENVYHYHPKDQFTEAESRRMIYAFKVRMEQDGVFGVFDCPDGSLVVPRRTMSTTPLQALNLFNSSFVLTQSQKFADRIQKEASSSQTHIASKAAIERAWNLAYNRKPSPEELQEALTFSREHDLAALCRAVLNSNEFLFIP